MKTIILSVDPGKLNFAYSFMTPHGVLIKTGMLRHTMTDLKSVDAANSEIDGFLQEIKELSKGAKLRLVFERFVPRGSRYFGNLIEITCMKIGMMLAVIKANNDCITIPILASSWKNFLNKKNLRIENDSAPEHILDAISMGIYYLIQKEKITLKQAKTIMIKHSKKNYNWYKYKNEWYFGKRKKAHARGRKNSFGN
jgi:hypothetical protein